MTNLEKLQEQIKNFMDAADKKEDISALTMMNQTCEDIKAEMEKNSTDYKELLSDYKEVIKHTSFKPEKGEDTRDKPEAPVFADFFTQSGNMPG